jgi:polysaccharide biosynthesis transport protein
MFALPLKGNAMSKNAELLRRAEKEHEVFHTFNLAATNGDGKHARLDVAGMARDEAIKLVERLFLSAGAKMAPRTVVFSSVDPGDGSSRICARVGKVLASRVPGSVCMVDANLYSPSLHRRFGMEDAWGLEEMAAQPGPIRTFARQISNGNLWLVTSGKRNADPHAVLASDGIRARLAELRNEFDYILIEAPAVSVNGTATLLGPLADGVVLIVEANLTRREVARKAKENLVNANVRLLGAVLNNRTFPIPEAIYRSL